MVERFEAIEYYKDDPRTMSFLKNNYRSHHAIIAVPSKLFYNEELVTADDAPPRDTLANWEVLPNKVNWFLKFKTICFRDSQCSGTIFKRRRHASTTALPT